jgi:hypothetical protein
VKQIDRPVSLGSVRSAGSLRSSDCVSPDVRYRFGVASATEAVAMGNRLNGEYAWCFRGAGLVTGDGAVALYLRRRNECDLHGARWRTIATAAAAC